MYKQQSGQTLIEGLIVIFLMSLTLIGSGSLFYTAFMRLNCEKKLFKITRSALNDKPTALKSTLRNDVLLKFLSDGIEGSIQCQGVQKKLFLPSL